MSLLTPRAQPPRITGAILAGGLSRRFGRDKAAVKLNGVPLVLRVARLLAAQVSEIWLITNQPVRHAVFGLPLAIDLVPHQGPAGGLVTALFYSPGPWVLAAAVDNPFVSPTLLADLARRADGTSRAAVVCCSPGGLEPFPGLYAKRLLPRLVKFLQSENHPKRFLEICRPQVISEKEVRNLDPEFSSFINLNTPRDLELSTAAAPAVASLDNHRRLKI